MPSGSAPGQPGQAQHGPLDRDGGVRAGQLDDRARRPGAASARALRTSDRVEVELAAAVTPGSVEVGSPSAASSRRAARSRRARRCGRQRRAPAVRRRPSVGQARRRQAAGDVPDREASPARPARARRRRRGARRASRRGCARRTRPARSIRCAGLWWHIAARTPPHGSSGVTGRVRAEGERAPRRRAIAPNGFIASARVDAEPLRRTCRRRRPRAASNTGCTLATTPSRPAPRSSAVSTHLDVLEPVPAARTASTPDRVGGRLRTRPAPSSMRARRRWRGSRPARPASVQATRWSATCSAVR